MAKNSLKELMKDMWAESWASAECNVEFEFESAYMGRWEIFLEESGKVTLTLYRPKYENENLEEHVVIVGEMVGHLDVDWDIVNCRREGGLDG